jgi:hypothetical protein
VNEMDSRLTHFAKRHGIGVIDVWSLHIGVLTDRTSAVCPLERAENHD